MKNFSFLVLTLFIFSCKQNSKIVSAATADDQLKEEMVVKSYSENLQKVFDTHGGLDLWRKQRTLIYNIAKPDSPETHTIDLWKRIDRIDTEKFSMGFDGIKPWLLDEKENYKGNVEFYHNLMFYFYAMPFVLGDDGIVYGETEDLVFEGINYPGIRVSYNNGIGTTPKDEYFIHFDTETNQMAWLGYTVTYRIGEKSDNVKWIRYDNWEPTNGLALPKSITWYNYVGREIQEARNTVDFENISVSQVKLSEAFYAKPEKAVYWEKPRD